MKKKNIISLILYFLILTIYTQIKEYEMIFMWLSWAVGYSKNIWDYIE